MPKVTQQQNKDIFRIFRMLRQLWVLMFITDFKTFYYFLSAILTSIPSIFRQKGFYTPFQKMVGKKCVFKILGKKIIFDGLYFGYAGEVYARTCYTFVPGFNLSDCKTVIDLGSEGGVFSILAAKFADRVIAVEANHRHIINLRHNAEINNCMNNIEIIWGVIGYNSGMLSDKDALEKICGKDLPPMITFDEIINKHNIFTIDFLKIDIEGSEFNLFRGDTPWLNKVKHIAMEVHQEFGKVGELKEKLENNSFEVNLFDEDQKDIKEGNDIKKAIYLFASNNLSFTNT